MIPSTLVNNLSLNHLPPFCPFHPIAQHAILPCDASMPLEHSGEVDQEACKDEKRRAEGYKDQHCEIESRVSATLWGYGLGYQ